MIRRSAVLVIAGLILASSSPPGLAPARAAAQGIALSPGAAELLQVLGEGVVGSSEPAPAPAPIDPARLAWWEAGEWRYRITAGARRGQTESEILAPIGATTRGETWKRTVGRESTLYLRWTAEGNLVLPSQITHAHEALVLFEPALIYLTAGLGPGERRLFDGRMDVYSLNNPTMKWYSGRIRATTVHAGVYRVTTPAGEFSAVLIRTDYQIDILAVVSVRDTLLTFYAEGVGKVAEAEHRRISAMGLFSTDTKIGRVLVSYTPSYTPISPPTKVESP